jgi:hypothetical protein
MSPLTSPQPAQKAGLLPCPSSEKDDETSAVVGISSSLALSLPVSDELFVGSVARLYEFPQWEELKIFDSDDLWEEKCFALIPSSYTLFPEKEKMTEGMSARPVVPMVSEVEVYFWLGDQFDYSAELLSADGMEKEERNEDVEYHFPTHDNEDMEVTGETLHLHRWIQNVSIPLIRRVIGEKNWVEKVRVVVYVEKQGQESEEFWNFFENG